LYALNVTGEPISGLLVAGLAAGLAGMASGALILRTRGLTLVTLTLAIATMLHELANSWKSLTGGADGLYGFRIDPVLGRFPFDLFGRTGFLYAVAVLACLFFFSKALVNSPFGLTMRGIRENPVRMRMLGVPVKRRLVTLYAISAAVAG